MFGKQRELMGLCLAGLMTLAIPVSFAKAEATAAPLDVMTLDHTAAIQRPVDAPAVNIAKPGEFDVACNWYGGYGGYYSPGFGVSVYSTPVYRSYYGPAYGYGYGGGYAPYYGGGYRGGYYGGGYYGGYGYHHHHHHRRW